MSSPKGKKSDKFSFSEPLTESNLEAPPIGSYCQLCSFPMCSADCASAHPCQYGEECELLAKIAISPTEDVKVNQPSLVSLRMTFCHIYYGINETFKNSIKVMIFWNVNNGPTKCTMG